MATSMTLMGVKHPCSFIVDDEIVDRLLKDSKDAQTKGEVKSASNYVNNLLKWAINNYKEKK